MLLWIKKTKTTENINFMRNNRDNFKPKKRPFQKDSRDDRENHSGKKPGSFERFARPERQKKPFDPEKRKFEQNKRPFDPEKRKFEPKSQQYTKPKFEKSYPRPKPERAAPPPPPPAVAPEQAVDSGLVYGRNAVIELLRSGAPVDKLFLQSGQREGSITLIFSEAKKRGIPILEVAKVKLDSMVQSSSHQGAIAQASEKEYCSPEDILEVAEKRGEKPFVLIADRIMDPHNLGAIIRTAECAGAHGLIIPKRNAAGVSPIVAKVSAGASVHLPIAKVANIAGTIEELKKKGIWIFSAVTEPKKAQDETKKYMDYTEADYDMPLCLVVGNEGEGLAELVQQKSDFLVTIPQMGQVASLNVSCAAAVLMYEAARQRKVRKL